MRQTGDRKAGFQQRAIGIWLLLIAGMVFAMVVLGGITRLTQSGLSMVEWRPVTGWLPPLTQDAWQQAFAAYQKFPEYEKLNSGMTLAEFKGIYWLEYLHRLWGRFIGLAFALPFLFFLARGWIDRRLGWKLFGVFALGGAQGALGWYMVKSGLVDRPDVSQYRLVAHLGLAMLIYGYLLWVAFGLLAPIAQPHRRRPGSPAPRLGSHGLVLVTVLAGGFVAGLDAGFAYNTFPLMDGELIPSQLFATTPSWRAFFEDVTTVQFTPSAVSGHYAGDGHSLPLVAAAVGPCRRPDCGRQICLRVGFSFSSRWEWRHCCRSLPYLSRCCIKRVP